MIRLTEVTGPGLTDRKVVWINPMFIAAVEDVVAHQDEKWVNVELVNGSTYSVSESLDTVIDLAKAWLN